VKRFFCGVGVVLWVVGCDPKPEPTVAPTPNGQENAPTIPVDPFNPPPPPEEPPVDPNAPDPADPVAPDDEDIDPNSPVDPTDPLADVDDDAPRSAASSLPALTGDCRLLSAPKRVWPHAAISSVTAVADAFMVSGYERTDSGEKVFVARVSRSQLPQPLITFPLPAAVGPVRARVAPPGLATNADGSVTLVWMDAQGNVRARTVASDRPNGAGAEKVIAEGGDTRFAPAVAAYGLKTLIAWTNGRATPMRVWTTVIDEKGVVGTARDLTQTSMGAAAPTFLSGSNPPELMFVDPRAALSTLVRVPFKPDATPGEAQVVVPINSIRQPPQIAVARGGDRTWAAFTALGTSATTAVGMLSIEPVPSTPEALVPGTAYGDLHVGAVASADAALFVADTPTAPGKDTPRRVHLTRVTDAGRGQPTSIAGPDGTGHHGAIARGQDGTVAVSFDNDSGVYVAFLSCDATP